MREIKNVLKKISEFPLTVGVLILFPTVYQAVTSRSAAGCIGTTIFGVVLTAILEWFLRAKLKIALHGYAAAAFIMLMILYGLGALIFPKLFFTQIALSMLVIMAAAIPVILIISGKKKTFQKVTELFMMLGFCVAFLYLIQHIGAFSPDSYAYHEISETFFKDFGRVGTIRQYVVKSDYNMSFPYFYPLLIFITDTVTGLGMYSGVLLNVFIMLYTGTLFLYVSRHFSNRAWPGAMAIFLLFSNIHYLDELICARSIPAEIFFVTLCVSLCVELYLNPRAKIQTTFLAGLFAGIAMVIRFDGAALAAVCVLMMPVIRPKKRMKSFLMCVSGLLMAVLPWMIYSAVNMGMVWANDNSGTMFLVNTVGPGRINPPGNEAATLFNAPREWLVSLTKKTAGIITSLIKCSLCSDLLLVWLFVLTVRRAASDKTRRIKHKKMLRVVAALFVFYAGKTFVYALVGYGDTRYHVETVIIIMLAALILTARMYENISNQPEKYEDKAPTRLWIGVLLSCLMILITGFRYRGAVKNFFTGYENQPLASVNIPPSWVENLNAKMNEKIPEKDSEFLFLEDGHTFGGWTDWKIYVAPTPATWENIDYAMRNYMDVDYVVMPKETDMDNEITQKLSQKYEEIEIGDYRFYKVKSAVQMSR